MPRARKPHANTAAECRAPNNCRATGKGLCMACAHDSGKLSRVHTTWTPPEGSEGMFKELRRKVGRTEAQRLVEDHVRRGSRGGG